MAGKKGKIFTIDLASIRQCYKIPKEVELLATDINNIPQSSKSGCICINESMFKVKEIYGVPDMLDLMDDSADQEAIRGGVGYPNHLVDRSREASSSNIASKEVGDRIQGSDKLL
ncbi:hypothetical protein ACLOJK_005628 [Asimina triloba]